MRKIFPLVFFLLSSPVFSLFAQGTITVEGSYTHYASPSLNPSQAETEALFQTKLHIIAEHFGTVLSSTSFTQISNIDGTSASSSSVFGESEVKGEWIETIGEPSVKQQIIEKSVVTTVSIKGKIRKITSSQIDIIAKPLSDKNNPDSECFEFRNNQNFYVAFKTPVKGYLTIYISDNTNVFRLLPERNNEDASFKVSPGVNYCFFDDNHSDGEFARGLKLTTGQDVEINRLYLIFSTNPFTKAIDDTSSEETAAPTLPWSNFQKWLGKCRIHDRGMTVKAFDIVIRK